MSSTTSVFARISGSMRSAIGDVTFGLADGAVSVTGLVFGASWSWPGLREPLLEPSR